MFVFFLLSMGAGAERLRVLWRAVACRSARSSIAWRRRRATSPRIGAGSDSRDPRARAAQSRQPSPLAHATPVIPLRGWDHALLLQGASDSGPPRAPSYYLVRVRPHKGPLRRSPARQPPSLGAVRRSAQCSRLRSPRGETAGTTSSTPRAKGPRPKLAQASRGRHFHR